MRAQAAAATLILFLALVPLAACEVDSNTETLYMISDVFTTHETEGYGLYTSNTDETVIVELENDELSAGFRVFLLTSSGETELTSGTPTAYMNRSVPGYGSQSSTWTVTEQALTVGASALEVKLYLLGEEDVWTPKAVFVSETLLAESIEAATWTFTMYTEYNSTYAKVSWGSPDAEALITGLDFEEAGVWDSGMHFFKTNNWVMFFIYPYTRLIGSGPFASIILFAFGVTAYVRFRNFYWILLVMVLLSVGGVFNLVMGEALWGFAALLATFALAVLYWRVFR